MIVCDAFVLVLETVTCEPSITCHEVCPTTANSHAKTQWKHKCSNTGKIKASELLTRVTTAKLDSSWTNTYERRSEDVV